MGVRGTTQRHYRGCSGPRENLGGCSRLQRRHDSRLRFQSAYGDEEIDGEDTRAPCKTDG
jgi:hypothetical protein